MYDPGTWLEKPIKTIINLLPLFNGFQKLRILDLGCGVGRNCIPIAQNFSNIDCVDILDLAIDKLYEYSAQYNVKQYINGIVMPIEEFLISPNSYNLIIAISVLEHINNEQALLNKLKEIKEGVCITGFICLIINSEITEKRIEDESFIDPQFEINISTTKSKKYWKIFFKAGILLNIMYQHNNIIFLVKMVSLI